MPSLREVRKKIKTVRSTEQITKAMKMVAAARLRQAQARILSARPYAIQMKDLLAELAGRVTAEGSSGTGSVPLPHPLLESHGSGRKALLLITADKGLCGSFNTNLIKAAGLYLEENRDRDVRLFAAGRKGRDFFKRAGWPFAGEYVQIFGSLAFRHAEIIGSDLMRLYLEEKPEEVVIIYNEFKSVLQQSLVTERLLPVERPDGGSVRRRAFDFIYEPSRGELLDALLPRIIKSQVYRALQESYAAELGARMAAMDSAAKNAKELIDSLTLKLNRTRQAIITREIAELVGGAEALQ